MSGYVLMPDIKGESRDSRHKEWIEITGFDDGAVKAGSPRRTRTPRIRIPVWFRVKLWRYFMMFQQAQNGNRPCEGWFEFTDPVGRVLQSMEFRGGRIIRLRALAASGGGQGPDGFEVGLAAEEWILHQGPSPVGPAHCPHTAEV